MLDKRKRKRLLSHTEKHFPTLRTSAKALIVSVWEDNDKYEHFFLL